MIKLIMIRESDKMAFGKFKLFETDVEEEDTINLVELFFGWLKHIKFVIITTILTALCVAAVNVFLLVPVYQSTAELYILDASTSISSAVGRSVSTSFFKSSGRASPKSAFNASILR